LYYLSLSTAPKKMIKNEIISGFIGLTKKVERAPKTKKLKEQNKRVFNKVLFKKR